MRQHGISDFPDPVRSRQRPGRMADEPGGSDANSAHTRRRTKACSSLAQAELLAQVRHHKIPAWAACVRARRAQVPDRVNNEPAWDVDVTTSESARRCCRGPDAGISIGARRHDQHHRQGAPGSTRTEPRSCAGGAAQSAEAAGTRTTQADRDGSPSSCSSSSVGPPSSPSAENLAQRPLPALRLRRRTTPAPTSWQRSPGAIWPRRAGLRRARLCEQVHGGRQRAGTVTALPPSDQIFRRGQTSTG